MSDNRYDKDNIEMQIDGRGGENKRILISGGINIEKHVSQTPITPQKFLPIRQRARAQCLPHTADDAVFARTTAELQPLLSVP
jgi:hypothetical protein